MLLSGESEWNRGRCLAALAMLALMLLGVTASQSQGFCTTKVIHDYRAPLANLPSLPSPPIDEHLPFAHPRVFFGSLAPGPLQIGEGPRGFTLSFSPYEAGEPSPTLNWKLISTLTPIDPQGQAVAPAQTIERYVEKLQPEGSGGTAHLLIGFPIPGDPALYRLEIVIEQGDGERLAAFGEYFRVLRPDIDFHLSPQRKRFRPGQTVRVTLSNPGVAWLGFGLFRGIEYRKGKSWVEPPVEFPGGIVPAIGLGMGPGESKSCWEVEIPQNAVPGTYRFTTSVEVATAFPPRREDRRIAKASFTVPPPPRKAFAIAPPVPRP